MEGKPQTTLFIGFDRSGSSMISKLMAKHPEVNLIFQPFNNSELTHKQWEIWESNHQATPWFNWFTQLEKGYLLQDSIQSKWFFNHSSSLTFEADKINLIKDTKLHFKVYWLQENFPGINLYGIWRDPRSILRSLVRNDFHKTWYQHLHQNLVQDLIMRNKVFQPFNKWTKINLSDIEVMALGIALRIYYLMEYLPANNWIYFQSVLNDPNHYLNQFTANWGLKHFDFAPYLSKDYNIAGKPFEGENQWESFFTTSQLDNINEIFAPALNPE